ncbi:hypothetical protein [Rhodococcus sp. ACT016]|uniref:hypothetical protein n=1 Tax=Rhodococcus sp. ACT016 TaxID=3134808 RepID=UPI003D2903AF
MVSDSDKASRRSSRPHSSRTVADYRRRQAERQSRLDELVEAVLVAGEHRAGADANLDGEIAKLATKLDDKIAKLRADHEQKIEQLNRANEARTADLDERWAAALAELTDFASIAEVAFALDVSERQVKSWLKTAASAKPSAEPVTGAVAESTPAVSADPGQTAEPLRETA